TSADINAIPDDKWTSTFGGVSTSAMDAARDAVNLLLWATETIKGGTGASMEGLSVDCSTKANAVAALASAGEGFCAALAAASDETLNTIATPPWQMPAPIFMLAQIAVSHVWYHDGQLNYIQMLLGDEKVHWLG
ncbi:MAG TPA: hypothetical protein VK171_07295, partial [Fimbriimonas sp.]|nr:hypothetical protein [Fimbriimonas sp.]